MGVSICCHQCGKIHALILAGGGLRNPMNSYDNSPNVGGMEPLRVFERSDPCRRGGYGFALKPKTDERNYFPKVEFSKKNQLFNELAFGV